MPDLIDSLYAKDVRLVVVEPDGRQHTSAPRGANVLAASFNPLHRGHVGLLQAAVRRNRRPGYYELSIENVEKPRLPVEELRRRLGQFSGSAAVVATIAPTFVEKSKLMPGTVFVTGIDTAERLFDDRFYRRPDLHQANDPTESPASLAMKEIRRNGCRFVVAGRMMPGGRFLTLNDIHVPAGFRDMLEEIPEAQFREDISSSGILAGQYQPDR